jgi:hypothetical protein
MSTALKPKGVYWRDLSQAEKDEITLQIPKIQYDPNYVNYRYYKSAKYKWIICNAFTVPMKLKGVFA